MKKEIDFSTINSMSEQQQQQVYYTLAKRANQRFRDIGKNDVTSYAINKAKEYLNDTQERSTFKQSKKLTGNELKQNLKALEDFFTSKTSTMQGIKEVEKNHLENIRNAGIELKTKSDKKKFFDFLSSQAFKTLSKYADSNQVRDDFGKAIDEGYSVDEILKGYDEFIENDMTFEEVSERRAKIPVLLK